MACGDGNIIYAGFHRRVEDALKGMDGLNQGCAHLFVCFDTKMLSKENKRFPTFN